MSNDIKLTVADANSLARGKPRLPTIPTSFGTDPKQMLTAIKEILEVREGQRGSNLDRTVTFRDLFEQGVVALNIDGKAYYNAPAGPIVPGPSNGGAIDQTPPPPPTGLKAAGALASIILTWDNPTYGAHSHTEVWSSATDDLGTATLVGTSPSRLYVDMVGTGTKRYYWIKWVSKFPVTGPFNSTDGTEGETGYDAQYLIDVLSANPPPGSNYNPLLYVQNDPNLVVNGVPVPVGTYMTSAYIANASITRLKVGLAAIDDARIASLHAAKIVAGDIDADRMRANIVQAVQGQFQSLSAITAWLGNVTIGYNGWLKTDGVWDFMGGNGIFMGWHSDQYKFRVGDPGGQHIRYENGQLTIVGNLYSSGNGTFRGTFISGTANSLSPGGGESGTYSGPDGFFTGDGHNPLTGIPAGSAFMKMNRAEKRIEMLAENFSLTCGWPSPRWAIYNDGTASFREVRITGGDGVQYPKSASTSIRVIGQQGQSAIQFTLPGPAFVTLLMAVTAGSEGGNYACCIANTTITYDSMLQPAAYGSPLRAGLVSGSPETNVPAVWLPAGTYFLNAGANTVGSGIDSTLTAWAQIDPA